MCPGLKKFGEMCQAGFVPMAPSRTYPGVHRKGALTHRCRGQSLRPHNMIRSHTLTSGGAPKQERETRLHDCASQLLGLVCPPFPATAALLPDQRSLLSVRPGTSFHAGAPSSTVRPSPCDVVPFVTGRGPRGSPQVSLEFITARVMK